MDSILHAHSQTFIGVLASLLLITIIWNHTSNFVIIIIRERSNVILQIWNKLGESINDGHEKWKFLKPEQESILKKIESALFNNNVDLQKELNIEHNEENQQSLMQIEDEIDTYKETFIMNYSHSVMPMIDRKITSIEKSRKIVVSAIFALMSCLLVFLIDEAMAIFPKAKDFFATFLLIFLILGSSFWTGMWGSFFLRHLPYNFTKLRIFVSEYKTKVDSYRSYSYHKYIFIILLWGFFCMLIGANASPLFLKKIIIVGAGMIIPCLLIGFFNMVCRDYKEENPYSFAINHFIDFCALSILWCIILYISSKHIFVLSEIFIGYRDWNWLLIFLEAFLLFTGVIFPIFMPYLSTYILQWYMYGKMREPKDMINNDARWDNINDDVMKFYNSISTAK